MKFLDLCLAIFAFSHAIAPTLALAVGVEANGPPITAEARAKGLAAAPSLISAGGLDCKVTDARFISMSSVPDPRRASRIDSSFYELACAGGEGLIVQTDSELLMLDYQWYYVCEGALARTLCTKKPITYTCLQTTEPWDGEVSAYLCRLPDNRNPMAGLLPYIAKTGVKCTPDQIRFVDQSATSVLFEFACLEGNGDYMLPISRPLRLDNHVQAFPCITSGAGPHCTLRTRVGLRPPIDHNAGETDSRPQAQTKLNSLYSRLVKAAGYNCEASSYLTLTPSDIESLGVSVKHGGRDGVELVCANRQDGAIAIFSDSQSAIVYDCAHSELVGYRCSLTKAFAAYGRLTDEVVGLGKSNCTVSNARVVIVDGNLAAMEVACANAQPGYMIVYNLQPLIAVKSIIACAEVGHFVGGCRLPGNTKPN